jgi:hypothetical protein
MDSPSRLTLRIFVSSPGDVPVERDRAAGVVARLQEESPDEEWMRGIDEMRPHRPLFKGCY